MAKKTPEYNRLQLRLVPDRTLSFFIFVLNVYGTYGTIEDARQRTNQGHV